MLQTMQGKNKGKFRQKDIESGISYYLITLKSRKEFCFTRFKPGAE